MYSDVKKFLMLLVVAVMVSGCHAIKVLPESVCNDDNAVTKDELLGSWTLDTGFATLPSEITASNAVYRLRSLSDPAQDNMPGGRIDFRFRLCRNGKGQLLGELLPRVVDGVLETHVVVMSLESHRHGDIRWVFERPDPNRADLSELTWSEDPTPVLGIPKKHIWVNTTGAPLRSFLKDAPYQSLVTLRR